MSQNVFFLWDGQLYVYHERRVGAMSLKYAINSIPNGAPGGIGTIFIPHQPQYNMEACSYPVHCSLARTFGVTLLRNLALFDDDNVIQYKRETADSVASTPEPRVPCHRSLENVSLVHTTNCGAITNDSLQEFLPFQSTKLSWPPSLFSNSYSSLIGTDHLLAMATTTTQSNLVRLAPLQLGEIPAHASLLSSENDSQPDLLPFLLTLLDDGVDFLSPTSFIASFKEHSTKAALPSEAKVGVSICDIAQKELEQIVNWEGGPSKRITADDSNSDGQGQGPMAQEKTYSRPRRSKPPASVLSGGEHWFARKSVHRDLSSRDATQPGNASWKEFIFGLRDHHSKHEEDFTPNLFDAHHVCDWNEQVQGLESQGKIVGKDGRKYSAVTMSIYEMCHATPPPTTARCFPVLVATASLNSEEFIAVTVPVNLGSNVSASFYSSGRHLKEGKTPQQRKSVVLGIYAAVETVKRRPRGGAEQGLEGNEVEWVMATASDAKGNLPMWMQKLSLPGMLPKDVSYFMKWIKSVNEQEIEAVKVA